MPTETVMEMTVPAYSPVRPAHSDLPVVAIPEPARGAGGTNTLDMKTEVHRKLVDALDLERLLKEGMESGRRGALRGDILKIIADLNYPLSGPERDAMTDEVINEVYGLGPLQPLLDDPTINDILVNPVVGPKKPGDTTHIVFVERRGLLDETKVRFSNTQHVDHIIDRIVSPIGRRVDESSPMVDARLPDGSRVNIIVPPLSIDGPSISIRKFSAQPLTAEMLVERMALTQEMLEVLKTAVRAKLNVVISGGTGAGKTTLLNAMSGFISTRDRIITIEDSAELRLHQRHVIRLETRPPNVEGKGAVRQRELVINALRMRPERIVLGEVRGEEALDMLQAMNTGHDGSITTIHANTPRDAISRLETMCAMGNVSLPERAIRAQIASAVDLIVQVSRLSDGSRRVTHISEITGMSGDVVSLQDVFTLERTGVDNHGRVLGQFIGSGLVPNFMEKAISAGYTLPSSIFNSSVSI